MARPIVLFSGSRADQPLAALAAQAAEWGYQGLDLSTRGDHLEVQRALSEDDYCPDKLAALNRLELSVPVVSCHHVSHAICDPIGPQHRSLVPEYVWGDGDPEGVGQRAAEEVMATARAAQKLGASVLGGFAGSPIWSYVVGWPYPEADTVSEAFTEFARRFHPILDVCQECGLRYAFEVHPGQLAFDLYSAEMILDALDGREEFGFTLDPSHLHWIGVDPVEFVRRFRERIYHVHIKDVAIALNGRNSLLNSYFPKGDPRRGWDYRSPGRGGIDWEAFIRVLNEVHYEGPLAVEWSDAGMNRDFGAEEACKFVRRLDFEPPPNAGEAAFR
jgi:sugar phosphate isomerase/epimerase